MTLFSLSLSVHGSSEEFHKKIILLDSLTTTPPLPSPQLHHIKDIPEVLRPKCILVWVPVARPQSLSGGLRGERWEMMFSARLMILLTGVASIPDPRLDWDTPGQRSHQRIIMLLRQLSYPIETYLKPKPSIGEFLTFCYGISKKKSFMP